MFLKILQISVENTCVAGSQACSFTKKRLQQKCFPVKFLRTLFSTEQLGWLLFKIRNSNNLFKDVSAISLTHNQSLITCNSHNDKLIWKCIHLPKTCSDKAFFVADLEQTLFFLRSDLNINNFAVLLHFLKNIYFFD